MARYTTYRCNVCEDKISLPVSSTTPPPGIFIPTMVIAANIGEEHYWDDDARDFFVCQGCVAAGDQVGIGQALMAEVLKARLVPDRR